MFATGDKYEGDWKEDMMSGKGSKEFNSLGELLYSDGSKYEGDWLRSEKNGRGNCSY